MTKRTTTILFAIALGIASVAQAQTEGLKVRGRWVVDVLDRNGTLAQHVEFDNALTPGGMGVLARRLTGENVAGIVPRAHFRNLTVTNTTGNTGSGNTNISVVLSGHLVVDNGARISLVQTRIGTCGRDTAAAGCSPSRSEPGANFSFTSHQLRTPVAVTKDRIVRVKLTLTFS
jgi:hypothetical protein